MISEGISNSSVMEFSLQRFPPFWKKPSTAYVPNPMFLANSNTFATPPTLTEDFDNLSVISRASTFYEGQINDVSNLIIIKHTTDQRPPNNPGNVGNDADGNPLFLNGAGVPLFLDPGSDGTAAAGGSLFNKEDFAGSDADPTLPTAAFGGSVSTNKTGLEGLCDVDEISILCCPH
jgi:hypothetical protein